jgi:hypothetical protein
MAWPMRRAISGVIGYSLARPRMPSVPKSLVAMAFFVLNQGVSASLNDWKPSFMRNMSVSVK